MPPKLASTHFPIEDESELAIMADDAFSDSAIVSFLVPLGVSFIGRNVFECKSHFR